MSTPERSLNKAIAYVFIGFVVISAVLGLTFFLGPRSDDSRGLFQTSIRYYTKGTDKLFYSDYATAIIQDIQNIGIEVKGYPMEYSLFLDKVFGTKSFDLAIVEIEQENIPHLELFFKETASLNVFNFNDNIDEGFTSNLLKNITQEDDFYARKNKLFTLQDHLMSNVLPMIPLFTPTRTHAYWGNLNGFSGELGLSNSIPYMSFSTLRTGQTASNILRVGISRWLDLNPLSIREEGEKIIVSLVMDKLIETDEKGSPTKYGLIDNWEFTNQSTTLYLHVRNGVEWQPDPDGVATNQPLTAQDVVFTLDLLRSLYSNLNHELYNWIDSYSVYNLSTVEINIDSDPSTTEKEPYAFVLEDLSVYPLPKYYLNPSDATIAQVVTTDEWDTIGDTPFGTGKYIFADSQFDLGSVVLNRYAGWHGVGVLPGETTNIVFDIVELQTYNDYLPLKLDLLDGTKLDIVDFGVHSSIELELQDEPNIFLDFSLADSIIFVAFNLANSVFGAENNFANTSEPGISKALAIRKAIASTIKRSEINAAFHNGRYNLTDTPISQYYKDYYNPNVDSYDYDLDQAISYLQLAGFNISTDRIPYDRTSFNLISSTMGLCSSVLMMVLISKKRRKV